MWFGERNFLIQSYFSFSGRWHCKGLEVFLYSQIETLPILQNAASRLVIVWNGRGMSLQLILQKVERETGGDEPSSDQKILPFTGTTLAGVWRRRGLSGSAYKV
jgi:hypothetical protein